MIGGGDRRCRGGIPFWNIFQLLVTTRRKFNVNINNIFGYFLYHAKKVIEQQNHTLNKLSKIELNWSYNFTDGEYIVWRCNETHKIKVERKQSLTKSLTKCDKNKK